MEISNQATHCWRAHLAQSHKAGTLYSDDHAQTDVSGQGPRLTVHGVRDMQALQGPHISSARSCKAQISDEHIVCGLHLHMQHMQGPKTPTTINFTLALELEPVCRVSVVFIPLLSRDEQGKEPGPKKKEYRCAVSQDLDPRQNCATRFTTALFSTTVSYRRVFGP